MYFKISVTLSFKCLNLLHSHNPTQIPHHLDSGANFHAYHQNDHAVVPLTVHRPVGARAPNGTLMHSTKEVTAIVPVLLTTRVPQHHFNGHILPALAQHTILSIGKFCDAGCQCILQADKVYIIKNNHIIMEGKQSTNGLWYLEQEKPPSKNLFPKNDFTKTPTINSLQNVHQANHIREAIQFMHATLFSPAKSTLLCASRLGILPLWPLLTYHNISKHLSETCATHLGHLQRVRKNLRSTNSRVLSTCEEDTDTDPVHQEYKTHLVYLTVLNTNRLNGTGYSDLTGQFPTTSASGNRYLFIYYSYDANAILWEPMKSRNNTEMIRVFDKIYTKLVSQGITPILNVMDNEASAAVTAWLTTHGVNHQKVPPYNHRANHVKRAIKKAKHHLLAAIASTDKAFPINQWDRLVNQGQSTLNMLRPCRINPKILCIYLSRRSPQLQCTSLPTPRMENPCL